MFENVGFDAVQASLSKKEKELVTPRGDGNWPPPPQSKPHNKRPLSKIPELPLSEFTQQRVSSRCSRTSKGERGEFEALDAELTRCLKIRCSTISQPGFRKKTNK